MRLEINELETPAASRHRQHVATYEEAAAIGLANVEQRAERNHLETVAALQAALSNSEYKAATREKTSIAGMSLAQAQVVEEDNSTSYAHQKHLTDALDYQLEEARYAQNLQEQAHQHVENSQEVMLEQFQAHFQVFKKRQKEEYLATVSELREQNDELQDRFDSADGALEKALDQVNPATPKGQPTPALSTPKAGPSVVPKAPQAPLFTMPSVLPQGARNLFDYESRRFERSPTFLRTTPAGPAQAKASGVAAPPAADPGTPSAEVLNAGLVETQMAIINSLKKLKNGSRGDSGKPKVKEAETINLPEFPNPESHRSWKTATREAVRAASEAFKWNHDSLRDPGKFLTLDTKLLAALTKVARGELTREILIFKETEASKSRAVTGRQVLYLFDQYFKTNEEAGSLYSVEDLLKVRLLNDDLSTFIKNWETVMSGLSHTPDETTLRDILVGELRQSKRLQYDIEIYDRAREGSEQRTYRFLVGSLKDLLTRERKRKNRDRIARSHGDKYGAAASSPGRTSSASGRGGRGRSQSPRPRFPGRSKSHSPGKSRSPSPKGVCYDFLQGTCKRDNNCPFLHKKRSLSPKDDKPQKKISKTCKFWKEGNCTRVDKCWFQHEDVEKPSAPAPKSEAAPAAPKAGSPRANSPAPCRGGSPGAKSSDKAGKPAACAISLEHAADLQISPKLAAAASHDEDFWEVDFTGNRLIVIARSTEPIGMFRIIRVP